MFFGLPQPIFEFSPSFRQMSYPLLAPLILFIHSFRKNNFKPEVSLSKSTQYFCTSFPSGNKQHPLPVDFAMNI
jgi:hypothetical protein